MVIQSLRVNTLLAFMIVLLKIMPTAQAQTEYGIPAAIPLRNSVDKASIVVFARLKQYTAFPPENPNHGINGKSGDYQSFDKIFSGHIIMEPGTYQFQAIQFLKGVNDISWSIDMPSIVDFPYRGKSFDVRPNETFLLLLGKRPDGTLYPIDPVLPLIPLALSEQELKFSQPDTTDIFSRVIDILLLSIKNEKVRVADTSIIRDIADEKIVKGLVPYLHDKDQRTQDNVLFALIINQQVAAIPSVLSLARETDATGMPCDSYSALLTLKTPQSAPYLNPLVFDVSRSRRELAISLLGNLLDQSSIPYLILATHDPDARYLGYIAYAILHQQILLPGPLLERDYFTQHPNDVISKIQVWWSDELLGKHLRPGQQLSSTEKTASLETLDSLNKALFKPYPSLRQEVMRLLEKKANKSSIPYLVLALQDPDAKVSYGAYKLLLRLTGISTVPISESAFATNSDAAKVPLYRWWADELNGKHSSASP